MNKDFAQYVLFGFFLGLVLGSVSVVLLQTQPSTDSHVKEVCSEVAPTRKAEYKGTQWENVDFYQVCVQNVTCTSPVVRCEVEK